MSWGKTKDDNQSRNVVGGSRHCGAAGESWKRLILDTEGVLGHPPGPVEAPHGFRGLGGQRECCRIVFEHLNLN